MQKLVFTNGNGNSIDLTGGNFGVTNWDGLSNTDLNIQTQQVPFNDGGVYLDALLEQREITVTVAIQDNNDLATRYNLRRDLISALNPKAGEGVLVYTNDYLSRQIKAVPQLPIFENKNANDSGSLKASVTFSCPSPYWEDTAETVVPLKAFTNTVVENNGDVPCGFTLKVANFGGDTFSLNGKNEKITLEDISDSDILTISTLPGKKSVISSAEDWDVSSYSTAFDRVRYAGGKFWMFKYSYSSIVSEDGTNWKIQYNNLPSKILDIIYIEEKGKYVAVTTDGYVGISEDAITWDFQDIGIGQLYNVIYSKERDLIITYNANFQKIATSNDGITWNIADSTIRIKVDGLAYNEDLDLFVACSNNDYDIYYSEDLITWTLTHTSANNQYLEKIISSKHGFLIICRNRYILTSPDGMTWTDTNLGNDKSFYDVNFVNSVGIYSIVANDYLILTSSDAVNWEENLTPASNTLKSIAYSEKVNKFVVVGDYTTMTSFDGKNYTLSQIGDNYRYKSITYSEDLNVYVAITDSATCQFLLSTNGLDFEEVFTINKQINRIKYIPDTQLFIAIGQNELILTSPDGRVWTERHLGLGTSSWFTGVDYSDTLELYVFIGYNDCLTTSDFVTYSSQTIGAVSWNDLIYSKEKDLFVAVGASNIATSSDSITWTSQTVSPQVLNSCAWAKEKNMFVVVGVNSVIYTSPDAVTWTSRTVISETGSSLDSVIYSEYENKFVAVGIYKTGSGGKIVKSRDGINWEQEKLIFPFTLKDIIYSIKSLSYIVISFGVLITSFQTNEKNIINKLTSDSDMNMKLNIGENNMIITYVDNSVNSVLTFRPKYIGV